MQRRRLLVAGGALAGGLAFAGGARASQDTVRSLRCYVVGMRFHDVDLANLRRGRAVHVQRDRYRDEDCYRVLDRQGRSIGFVPRAFIPVLLQSEVRTARVSKVNPHAVPWKQVEIVLSLS